MAQQQNPVRGFLSTVGLNPELTVEFQYNPTQLSDKRSVEYAIINAPGLLMPVRQYSHGGDRIISFVVHIDGLFDGPIKIATDENGGITPELNKYRAFLYPMLQDSWKKATSTFIDLYNNNQQNNKQQFLSPPTCVFGFGDQIKDCIVTEVSINETLFSDKLAPLRADVTVTLVEFVPYQAQVTPPPRGS